MKKLKLNGMVIIGLLVISAMLLTRIPSFAAPQKTAHKKVRVPVLTLPIGAGIYEWWASYENWIRE